jgi:phosphoglycerate kinase
MGEKTKERINTMQESTIFLLENLRFYPGEENPKEDPNFAKQLASYGEIYIDDAFGCAHRCHSSIVPICQFFKNNCYTGLLMDKELKALSSLYTAPKRPYLAILGGAKVESKIGVIQSIAQKVDAIMIVGGMSIIFLKALGYKFFSKLADDASINMAKEILELLKKKNIRLFLPTDVILSASIDKAEQIHIVKVDEGSKEAETAVDIGPETIKIFSNEISSYQTIFWNGPAGVFEVKEFENGTLKIAQAIAKTNCFSVVGGGDSAFAVEKFGLKSKFTHVSTGGGASLEFIELGTLPGIEAIKNAHNNV